MALYEEKQPDGTTKIYTEKEWAEKKNPGAGILGLAVLACFAYFDKFVKFLEHWADHTGIDKVVAFTYYFALYWPVKLIVSPWGYLYKNQVTSHSNLNGLLAILNIIVFAVIFLLVLRSLARALGKGFWLLFLGIYLGPLVLLLGRWIGKFLLN